MRTGLTTVVSFTPTGSDGRALGQYGHLEPATYSWTTPGGCDVLTAVFDRPPRFRNSALDNGRILRAYRGGTSVWEGILDEPSPGEAGWSLQAHGAGTWGNDYGALWGGTWGAGTPDDVVNQAIGRGLRWVNPGIGNPSGMWVGQEMDSATSKVTDVLNMACTKGGLTWMVQTIPRGNVLRVVALPTAATRLLVSGDPVPRSIAEGPTTLYVRYQATWDDPDNNQAATYAVTSVTNAALEASTGRREQTLDISSAGVYTAGQAQGVGNQVMKKFTRAAFTEPFTIRPGSLRNLGGQAVDPGSFFQDGQYGMVCRLLLGDYTPGSDSQTGAPVFLVGAYEWNDAEAIGTVTPAESMRHDFASLMSMIGETLPERTQPTTTAKAGK
jgi:hypothetical protein